MRSKKCFLSRWRALERPFAFHQKTHKGFIWIRIIYSFPRSPSTPFAVCLSQIKASLGTDDMFSFLLSSPKIIALYLVFKTISDLRHWCVWVSTFFVRKWQTQQKCRALFLFSKTSPCISKCRSLKIKTRERPNPLKSNCRMAWKLRHFWSNLSTRLCNFITQCSWNLTPDWPEVSE